MLEIGRLLVATEQGCTESARQLLPLVYEQLRVMAAAKLANEKPGQTLQATALVHEAFLRLTVGNEQQGWNSRAHFFAAAAEVMRRILIENARCRQRQKRGGGWDRLELNDPAAKEADAKLLALDDALNRLSAEDPTAAKVVELRHFSGLGHEGVALVLGLTIYQARQKWSYARAWLRDQLTE